MRYDKEYTIKDGYFLRMKKYKNVVKVLIYNTNNYYPVASLSMSLTNIRQLYFKRTADAEMFILSLLESIINYCHYEDEKR